MWPGALSWKGPAASAGKAGYRWWWGALDAEAFVVVGAAAFFTAAVRAVVTGIALLLEMTTAGSVIMPMLAAAGGAYVGASLFGGSPIYDFLRERAAGQPKSGTVRGACSP